MIDSKKKAGLQKKAGFPKTGKNYYVKIGKENSTADFSSCPCCFDDLLSLKLKQKSLPGYFFDDLLFFSAGP